MKSIIKDVFWLTLIVWILVLGLFIFSKGYEFDESTHSLVGIFIKDLIVDWINKPTFSFQKIYNYGISYLAYYPKISLHYPPLPQIFFAISYIFFEESIIVSRFVALAFSTLSIILIYYTTFRIYRKKEIALISCLILITSPIMISFSTRAMQEIFFLFFFTFATFSYIALFKKANPKRYIACIILTVACVLTKWHALTIFPVIFFFTLFFHRKKMKAALICLILASAILAPYYLLLYKLGIVFLPFKSNVYTGANVPQWYQIEGWLYYPKTLIFDNFFLFMGILILISTFYYIKQKKKLWDLFLVWIVTVYIIMTIVFNKTPHYIINIIPALLIPSSFIIYKFIVKNKIYAIFFMSLLIVQFVYSFYLIPHGINNIEKISEVLREDGNVGIVTERGGASPFIFEIARMNKFNRQVFRPCLFLDLNKTPSELIQDFNIRYIIVMWDELDIDELYKIADEVDGKFPKVAEFDNYVVYENNKTIEYNETICNYICSKRQMICSESKSPGDVLK